MEHYLTKYLEINSPESFDWENARLTFAQKLSIGCGKHPFFKKHDLYEPLKTLNALRNKVGHDIEVSLSETDVASFKRFIKRLDAAKSIPELSPIDTVELFANLVCAVFAGYYIAKTE